MEMLYMKNKHSSVSVKYNAFNLVGVRPERQSKVLIKNKQIILRYENT